MKFNKHQREYPVGGAFMPAPPIYRPGERIDGPLADTEDERPKPVVSCFAALSISLPIERAFTSLRAGSERSEGMTSDPRLLPILVVKLLYRPSVDSPVSTLFC
jgi:hypothetical protein